MTLTGATRVAGVVGQPIAHSLSPVIHNAWIVAAGLDAVYVPFAIAPERFDGWLAGLRGGSLAGLNVTLPFKGQALAAADQASERARDAGAANLLTFRPDRTIHADNTDGLGLLAALAAQAPGFDSMAGPAVVLGAGGAAQGAAAAFLRAGAPEVRVVNRTLARAQALSPKAFPLERAAEAFAGANVVVNATSAGLAGGGPLSVPLDATPAAAIVMDMVYKPLVTPFLAQAQALGRRTVDGLEMLIRQAEPSFEAFFGQAPPDIDVRALVLKHLEGQ